MQDPLRCEALLFLAVCPQVRVEASVRVVGAQLAGGVEDKCGLADACGAVNGREGHRVARGRCGQQVQFVCASVDVPDAAGQVVHRTPRAGRAGRRAAEEERVVASQNRLVDALELFTGVDAQFVGKPYAHGDEGLQRFVLPLDRVQGTHAQAQQRFVEGVGRREHGQLV